MRRIYVLGFSSGIRGWDVCARSFVGIRAWELCVRCFFLEFCGYDLYAGPFFGIPWVVFWG